MDYFSHGVWSWIIFRNWKAVIFGLMPDNLSWVIFFFYNLFTNGFSNGVHSMNALPEWIFLLYNISHSFFVFLIFMVLVYLIFNKFYI